MLLVGVASFVGPARAADGTGSCARPLAEELKEVQALAARKEWANVSAAVDAVNVECGRLAKHAEPDQLGELYLLRGAAAIRVAAPKSPATPCSADAAQWLRLSASLHPTGTASIGLGTDVNSCYETLKAEVRQRWITVVPRSTISLDGVPLERGVATDVVAGRHLLQDDASGRWIDLGAVVSAKERDVLATEAEWSLEVRASTAEAKLATARAELAAAWDQRDAALAGMHKAEGALGESRSQAEAARAEAERLRTALKDREGRTAVIVQGRNGAKIVGYGEKEGPQSRTANPESLLVLLLKPGATYVFALSDDAGPVCERERFLSPRVSASPQGDEVRYVRWDLECNPRVPESAHIPVQGPIRDPPHP